MCASCLDAKTFPTTTITIELPTAYGTRKVTSGLIYVLKGAKNIFTKSFGYADFLEKKTFAPTTQIYIGSLKKQFIAAAILKLMTEGKLNLHAPISTYLKFNTTLSAKDSGWIKNTTLHHLLTHVSEVSKPPQNSMILDMSSLDCIYTASKSPSTPLKYTYNSVAYSLLELVIESVSGQSASDYITQNFIILLKMENTGFNAPDIPNNVRKTIAKNLCYPYHFFPKSCQVVSAYDPNQPRLFSTAEMFSTVEDLCKWSSALHSGRAFNCSQETANKLLHLLRGLYTPDEEGDSYYGYGIKTHLRNSTPIYWHEGLVTGASVYLEYDPATDTHVVIFSNNTGFTFNPKTSAYILNMVNDAF